MLINAADFLLSTSLPLRDTFQDECRRLEMHRNDGSRERNDANRTHPRRHSRGTRCTVHCHVCRGTSRRVGLRRVAARAMTTVPKTHVPRSLFPFSLFLYLSLFLSPSISRQIFPLSRRGSRTISNARARHGLTNARDRPRDSKAAAKTFRGRTRSPLGFIIAAVGNAHADRSRT